MKLKSGFVLHSVGEEHMVVATGEAAKTFNGLVRNNETANYIFELLMNEITEDEIVEKLCDKYDASADLVRSDVKSMIEKLENAGFLDK